MRPPSARGGIRYCLVLVLSLCLVSSGCTTMTAVPMTPGAGASVTQQLHRGDVVEVTLKDGQVRKFRITAVTEQAIEGANDRVAHADIVAVHVRTFSTGRTLGLAGGVLAGAAVLLVALIVAAGGGAVSD